MKVSVIMTSYNGANFIERQMDSLRDQSYKPDEVWIADDRSGDNTFQIVSSYIKDNHLDNWHAYQNKKNIGFIMNFFEAMEKATGEFVFFSDQDDAWELNKIEEMINIIQQRDDILVLMSKENWIDENDLYINQTQQDTKDVKCIDLSQEVKECLGSGHLLVLRKSFIDQYRQELISEGMTFDIPFCVIAAARNGLYLYDRRLVKRRIHRNNTSGIKKKQLDRIRDYDRYIQGRKMRLGYVTFLLKHWETIAIPENDKAFNELSKAMNLLRNSVKGLEEYKLSPLLQELFSNNLYLNKKISLANILAMESAKIHRKK